MGKGKKKGGQSKETKEVEVPTTSDAPSVSEVPSKTEPEDTVEEDFSGLTGGGKRNKPKKKKQETTTVETLTQSLAEVKTTDDVPSTLPSAPSTTAVEAKPEVKEEEAVGLGLGLEGGRRRPRKKKEPAAAKAPLTAPGIEQPSSTTGPGFEKGPVSDPSFPAPTSSWGRGRGLGGGEPQGLPSRPTTASAPFQQPPNVAPASLTSGPSAQTPSSSSSPSYTTIPSTAQKKVSLEPAKSAQRTPIQETALCRFKIPKRISGNTVPARVVDVITNYLQMSIQPYKIFRYDVSFKPERPKKMLPKAYMLSKNMHFKNAEIAFDQMKNCYTLKELPKVNQHDRFITNVELLDNNDKTMKFEVSYKFTGIVDLGTILNYMKTGGTSLSPPTEAIQCIDVVLRQGTLESYVKAGRQFFQRPARPIDLGDGLEMWTGLFQSGIFTSRSFINIDVAHKGFPRQQPLIDALSRDFRMDPNRSLEQQQGRANENFQSFLRGLRVVAMIGGDSSTKGQKREFICNGIVGPAIKERFSMEDPNTKVVKSMTVAEYFTRHKGVRIRYPNLNCVWVGPREKTIYYPMELLEVAYGQAQNKQLNETQLATMVRQAATPPDERKRKIEEVIKNMNYSNSKTFANFGLKISNEFFPVKAKVLMPPRLEVGGGQTIEPRKGSWMANRVYRPEALQSWGFIAIECDQNRCDFSNVINMMMNMGSQMGMSVSKPVMCRFDVTMRDLQNVLLNALEKEVRFLFIIVSARGRDYYHRVKQLAEREVGILTQCIKEQTATQRMNMQTAKNILLKVNSKLMGINQVLDNRSMPRCLKDGGVMVVGADVTHPSPDQHSIPSIAAVTASIDPKCFMYNIELSIQTPKKEMIVEFEDMMVDHLKIYRQHQKALPRKIFVFRDGVSEGQFAQVMNSELQAVHNAYRTLAGPNARPEVLFLLVQKRHHTRLFLPKSSYNVEPGTVVDTDIVHASELDFYLVSHQAIKGTARPTRYHAVCNDGCIPHDEVEQLTYYLCHLYSRCMRSVSYPTPTYYAHLACLRARSLTHGEKFDNAALERQPKRLRVMDKILKFSRMFFV